MNCPDCDRQLYGDTCSCGWTKNKSHVTGNPFKYGIEIDGIWHDRQCARVINSKRCGKYGTVSIGGGSYYCSEHIDDELGTTSTKRDNSVHMRNIKDILRLSIKRRIK